MNFLDPWTSVLYRRLDELEIEVGDLRSLSEGKQEACDLLQAENERLRDDAKHPADSIVLLELKACKAENERLQKAGEVKERLIQQLNVQMEQLQEENSSMGLQALNFEKELDRLREGLERWKRSHGKLNGTCQGLLTEKGALSSEIKRLREERDECRAGSKLLRKDLSDTMKRKNAEIERLREGLDDAVEYVEVTYPENGDLLGLLRGEKPCQP